MFILQLIFYTPYEMPLKLQFYQTYCKSKICRLRSICLSKFSLLNITFNYSRKISNLYILGKYLFSCQIYLQFDSDIYMVGVIFQCEVAANIANIVNYSVER